MPEKSRHYLNFFAQRSVVTAEIDAEVAAMARERLLSERIRMESFELGGEAKLDPRQWLAVPSSPPA
jgi:hypothetical protein